MKRRETKRYAVTALLAITARRQASQLSPTGPVPRLSWGILIFPSSCAKKQHQSASRRCDAMRLRFPACVLVFFLSSYTSRATNRVCSAWHAMRAHKYEDAVTDLS